MNGKREIVVVSVLAILALGLAPGAAKADFVFGKAVNPGPPINSPAGDGPAALSSDGLELYLSSARAGGHGDYDIWVTRRANAQDPWGPLVNLGPGINSAANEAPESISSDGLTLYMNASYDTYTATRPAIKS